jgi:hypothetical protein
MVIALNERGERDQLKIEGNSIRSSNRNVQPRLSDDGDTIQWDKNIVWIRLTDMEESLVGRWKVNTDELASIYYGPDNTVVAEIKNGKRYQLKIKGKSIISTHSNVQLLMSDDGEVLYWSDGTIWTRLSGVEQTLVGNWQFNGERTYIHYGHGNTVIAVNENGARDQLTIEGSSIIPTRWNVQPHLSLDGRVIDWGNGHTWIR